MKIKISYSDGERLMLWAVVGAIKKLIPGVTVKENDHNGVYKHVYLASKEPQSTDRGPQTRH